MFRVDIGDHLGRLKEAHRNMAQGIGNVFSDVETRLIQNDHRNAHQEEVIKQLCASLTNLKAN